MSAERESHFRARLLDLMPRAADTVQADPYFALLDQVLLDHHISAIEADTLIALAVRLDLSRTDAIGLHHDLVPSIIKHHRFGRLRSDWISFCRRYGVDPILERDPAATTLRMARELRSLAAPTSAPAISRTYAQNSIAA
ncbi:hypothetical protein HCN51_57225 [Nonomuraea sp. FMUSA5-5]|uniref:Uncharacterized protein n=1 Tax=Nonomuraea composti TaxID=2720023 RepID=A0ABX1BP97_9ACTN|nr:hypothetical protein [Nonomuraea sp. FMUSA5-5]